MTVLITAENLCVSIGDKEILRGVNVRIGTGEVHFLMGPNGSGKTTLANVLMGSPAVRVTGGRIEFAGEDIASFAPEVLARKGIYLGFQQPVEVPGVGYLPFLRATLASRGDTPGPEEEFRALVASLGSAVGAPAALLDRNLNEGFSGGEKKRSELLQLQVLQPRLAILDEIDSGLDVDGLHAAAAALQSFLTKDRALLLITHSGRMAEYLKPDAVHIMSGGRIVRSGGQELIASIETNGFEQFSVSRG